MLKNQSKKADNKKKMHKLHPNLLMPTSFTILMASSSPYRSTSKSMFFRKPALLFSFFLLISLFTLGFAQSPGAAFYREGVTAFKARNYEQAVSKFDQAIAAESSNYRYYVMKGQTLIKMKNIPGAIAAYEGATQANPGFADGFKTIGLLYMKQKEYDNAVISMNKAFNAETDQSKKLYYKLTAAKLLLQQNKFNEALSELSQAKSIQPNDTRILDMEGKIHIKNNNWQAAYDVYGQAENMARQQQQNGCGVGQFQAGKAVAAAKLGKDAEYKSIIDALNQSCPNMAKWAVNMVRASGSGRFLATANGYLKAMAYDEALQQVNLAIQAGDNKVAVHKFAAVAYFKAGQPSVAVDHFKKAAEASTNPDEKLGLYNQLAKMQFNSQDYRGAVESIDKILAAKPNEMGLMFMKAQAQYNLGQYREAAATAENVYNMAANAPAGTKAQYQFFIGMANKKAGNNEKAAAAFKTAQVGPFKLAASEELKNLK